MDAETRRALWRHLWAYQAQERARLLAPDFEPAPTDTAASGFNGRLVQRPRPAGSIVTYTPHQNSTALEAPVVYLNLLKLA